MSQKQKTIKKPITVSGVGLHTGAKVNLTFKPAPENHWYKFVRTDIEGSPVIDVDALLTVMVSDLVPTCEFPSVARTVCE